MLRSIVLASCLFFLPTARADEKPTHSSLPIRPASQNTTDASGLGGWNHGHADADPMLEVRPLDDNTFVIRQSISTDFEAPFLYLLFGNDEALLLDTGAQNVSPVAGVPLRETVDRLIDDWMAKHPDWVKKHPGQKMPLLRIAHTHAHGDHFANDNQFEDRPHTQIAKIELDPPSLQKTLQNVKDLFGKPSWVWPNRSNGYKAQIIDFDLGGRKLSIIPTPGHEGTHISIYDPETKTLFTGDSLYPGRLYVRDWGQYRASIHRLVEFADSHPVSEILGGHIEMTTTPRKDFPDGAIYHPNEHTLPLTLNHLRELDAAIRPLRKKPSNEIIHNDFIVVPVPGGQ